MKTNFVRAVFDIGCEWEGLPPIYRIYVNDELFAERTWIWSDNDLSETLQISAPAGIYEVRLEPVKPHLAKFTSKNFRIEYGPGLWHSDKRLEIHDEST